MTSRLSRYAVFLRGINLGGRRVTGDQLRTPLVELGFRNTTSFLASGNLVFDSDDGDDLEARIASSLEAALGFPVEAFVRTAAEVSEIATHQPFADDVVTASTGKPQVTFLHAAPSPDAAEWALAHATEQDRLVVHGREWYWLPSAGVSKSPLDVRAIERALGRGTTRTHTTVSRLHSRFLTEPPT